ncbi:MAG TPA: hypothetical protein VFX60_06480, partial [Micromonospora sp.]|nr:hypothetical protein [Micromonospora sp.]
LAALRLLLPGADLPFVFHQAMRVGLVGTGIVLLGVMLAWASIREKQLSHSTGSPTGTSAPVVPNGEGREGGAGR